MNATKHKPNGLSTLEMVLALPLLLFIMALMLNFGTVASWKVRGLTAARHAAWSSRWPRDGLSYPRPENWPTTANLGAGGEADFQPLDDPRVYRPVARGPMLPMGTAVNERLLDPSRGFRDGVSHLARDFPLLARMGQYRLDSRVHLLDDQWQFQRFGLPSNNHRRIPVIYLLAKAPTNMAIAYVRAVMAVYRAPFRAALMPLDRDDEFAGYARRFGWGNGSPDFHPRLAGFCSLDKAATQERVDELIKHIEGGQDRDAQGNVTRRVPSVAERMTRAFINLYQRVIQELQSQLQQTPPPANPGAIQAEIKTLQGKIDVLQNFLSTL